MNLTLFPGWWKCHKEQFPLLSYIVRVVFGVPVASSKSERGFSVADNMVTPKRAKLSTESTESLVIIKPNLSILREMGVGKECVISSFIYLLYLYYACIL